MIKLLVIADDFTGALDTGVQFAGKGIETKIVSDFIQDKNAAENSEAEVWVIDAKTRHLEGRKAYEKVYEIVKRSKELHIPYIYKKTDSGLRGNIGCELEAALNASGETYLTFIPALPAMERVTKGGIHYIKGVPISESAFSRDLFDPVMSSSVLDLFASVPVKLRLYPGKDHYSRGEEKEIGIFDASTEEDIRNITGDLMRQNQMGVMAGCAGFASVIAGCLGLQQRKKKIFHVTGRMMIACGSVNEITGKQVEYAQLHGMKRIVMTPKQQLQPDYLNSEEGKRWLKKLKQNCESGETYILETGISDTHLMDEYRLLHGISLEKARVEISETIGTVLKKLLDMGLDAAVMVIGGDTLAAFISKLDHAEITICQELEQGTVLSFIETGQKKYWLISKSGGFGSPELLCSIERIIKYGKTNEGGLEKK